MNRYKILEHVADIYIAAYGKNLKEAFENAAYAMFDSMTDIEKIKPITKDKVQVEARDKVALLHDWLLHLLLKFDIETTLLSKFEIKQIKKEGEQYILIADISGETLDPQRHPSKVDIKAVTYHQMSVEQKEKGVEVRFILDV